MRIIRLPFNLGIKILITCMVLLTMICTVSLVVAETTVGDKQAQIDLGRELYLDTNLSANGNQSCATCHNPNPKNMQSGGSFVDDRDPVQALIDAGWPATVPSPVSQGSDLSLFGGRNTPSSAYAAFSPGFRFGDLVGLYVGGQFWDGREISLAGQAAGPFRNPVEMAMLDKKAVVQVLQNDPEGHGYHVLFNAAYVTEDGGFDLNSVDSSNNQTVLETYDLMAKAIGEFEKTQTFNTFNSKYDYYLTGQGTLTSDETKGLQLFSGKGKCGLCHITQQSFAPNGGPMPPLLTDFTYDNLGIPRNAYIDILKPDTAPQPIDLGLGGVLGDTAQNGKFKVMTLRNIELTAPYAHNGVFQTLEQIVHFYNTRDAMGLCADNMDPGFGITCWPAPEVTANVNVDELGNLMLNQRQEQYIVAFLKTLTDRDITVFPSVFNVADFPPMP